MLADSVKRPSWSLCCVKLVGLLDMVTGLGPFQLAAYARDLFSSNYHVCCPSVHTSYT